GAAGVPDAFAIVGGDVDGRARHQLPRGVLDELDRDRSGHARPATSLPRRRGRAHDAGAGSRPPPVTVVDAHGRSNARVMNSGNRASSSATTASATSAALPRRSSPPLPAPHPRYP